MKTLTVQVPDDVYEGMERRAASHGATLDEEITAVLKSVQNDSEEARITAARARMRELFRTIKGFRLTPVIPREDLYERGSLR
jgi:hypothetical protein